MGDRPGCEGEWRDGLKGSAKQQTLLEVFLEFNRSDG